MTCQELLVFLINAQQCQLHCPFYLFLYPIPQTHKNTTVVLCNRGFSYQSMAIHEFSFPIINLKLELKTYKSSMKLYQKNNVLSQSKTLKIKQKHFCLEFRVCMLFTPIGNNLIFRSHFKMPHPMEPKMPKWSVIMLSKHFIFQADFTFSPLCFNQTVMAFPTETFFSNRFYLDFLIPHVSGVHKITPSI